MSDLAKVLEQIGTELKDEIDPKSRMYFLVDLGWCFEQMQLPDADKYKRINAVVPVKKGPAKMVPAMVNGRDLGDYRQLQSGIAVPEPIANESGMPHTQYEPKDSMILYL